MCCHFPKSILFIFLKYSIKKERQIRKRKLDVPPMKKEKIKKVEQFVISSDDDLTSSLVPKQLPLKDLSKNLPKSSTKKNS